MDLPYSLSPDLRVVPRAVAGSVPPGCAVTARIGQGVLWVLPGCAVTARLGQAGRVANRFWGCNWLTGAFGAQLRQRAGRSEPFPGRCVPRRHKRLGEVR